MNPDIQDYLPEEMWDDPSVKGIQWPAEPDGETLSMDITNADPETLLQFFDTLSNMVDWQDLRTASAGAARSNLEDAYKHTVDEKFTAIPKAEGPEAYREAKARLDSASAQYVFQKARTRHEIYKSILRRLERRLRVVEETLWTRKAALKARGGY